ncbi:hypothetical protein [Mesorhizobium sp. M0187]|uniref:hypothetical protein n=1 Tax=Mesorhizobium sp. M0187 TaxID=2956908 RepID=UPI00333A5ADF
MSTSETTEFAVMDCPCGRGKILRYITTQDNPWSSAHSSYGTNCGACSDDWEISNYGTMTNRESERPYKAAYREEQDIVSLIHAATRDLIDQYFEEFASKPATVELREMQRLGVARLNIDQFRQARRQGSKPSENIHALRNLTWLTDLAHSAGREDEFGRLRADYEAAATKTKEAKNNVISRSIPRSYP